MRGVDVRLLVPRWSDSTFVSLASHSYFDELMAADCRIFEHSAMLHSKVMIIDERLAFIGSANMDIRSFHLNHEITAMFYSPTVNADLAALFLRQLESARELRLADRRHAQLPLRMAEAAARALSPLL